MGVNCEGHLNVPFSPDPLGIGVMGLRYVPTGAASTEPGCACEGWGVADVTTGVAGYANVSSDGGAVNLQLLNFDADASTAIATVQVGNTFRVTHTYRPNPQTANVYDVLVTITNISAAPTHVRYRRVMDWDVYPTPFHEYVTIVNGNAPSLFRTDTNGFNSANPFSFTTFQSGPVTDVGPADHGALFDFDFGVLSANDSISFRTLYGAAGNESAALAALAEVGAEAYSLGQPSTPDGPTLGEPNTFVFGFAGIGGNPVGCGNGTVEPGEQCDDSNNVSGDGCDANCTPTRCGNGILTEGEQCDDGNSDDADCCSNSCQAASAGTACELDGSLCTIDQCNGGGACAATAQSLSCDDDDPCNGIETCNPLLGCVDGALPDPLPETCSPCGNGVLDEDEGCDPALSPGDGPCCDPVTCQPRESGSACSDDQNPCTDDVCNDSGSCLHEPIAGPCDDDSACTVGDQCSDGVCVAGAEISCDDGDACTSDSCDPQSGCRNSLGVESVICGTCADGIDNDGDGLIDGEQQDAGVCVCSTLCKQYRFAATVTSSQGARRFAAYTGSDVTFASAPVLGGQTHAGFCGTNAAIRAGGNFGVFAVTGNADFGKGAALDPDLDGEDPADPGSGRNIDIREEFASDGGAERVRNVAPLVGPGVCSNNGAQMCIDGSACGAGNSCNGRKRLNTAGNTYVSRNGTAENFGHCVAALAAVPGEATLLSSFAGSVPGYDDGSAEIATSVVTPVLTLNVGPGQQVMRVRRVVLAGKTRVHIHGTPTTTLLIRVERGFRLGGEAQIVLGGGLTPDRVVWLIEGHAGGRPKLLRASKFEGTLIAPERRGVLIGGLVTINGAVKCQRLHIGQGSRINHMPFSSLLM